MTDGVSVELNDLTRVYGSVKALDGLTLHIEPGELVALLGPSGCGKTTALRILAGLDEATSGTVSVGGRDLTKVPANKRDMGMVFQAYSLFPHLTVLDNVAFGLKMRGKAKGERLSRADDMLELVGLSAHRHKYASELSGGQQQRVALARALAIQPRVLLLDEPLSALDAKVRVQLRDEIRRVQLDVGTTTLFVTHDQEEALAVADRVGVMSQGKLEQLAAPAELYANPATPFVAEFVGLEQQGARGGLRWTGPAARQVCACPVRLHQHGHRAGDGAARVGDRHRRPVGHRLGDVGRLSRPDLTGVLHPAGRNGRRCADGQRGGAGVLTRRSGDRRRRADRGAGGRSRRLLGRRGGHSPCSRAAHPDSLRERGFVHPRSRASRSASVSRRTSSQVRPRCTATSGGRATML